MIRKLEYEDFDKASDVLWRSFYDAEKHNTSMEGMELFRDLTAPVSLSINTFDGTTELYGVFSPDLCAVGAVKDQKQILLLYVHPERKNEGIGSRLLSHLECVCEGEIVHLNASDYALQFYKKRGYEVVGGRREESGLIFTPMEKKK